MAVIKVHYTKSKAKIKAHVRYITHRPGRDNERTTRVLFNREGQSDKLAAYRMIDEASRGARFFKVIISPDPKREDTGRDLDLWRITARTLSELETRLGRPVRFIGVTHTDHSPTRHVHVILSLTGRLTRADIQALRQAATEAALFQRRERDLARGVRPALQRTSAQRRPAPPSVLSARVRQHRAPVRPWRLGQAPHCPRCFASPVMEWRPGNAYQCPSCALSVTRNGYGIQIAEDRGWER